MTKLDVIIHLGSLSIFLLGMVGLYVFPDADRLRKYGRDVIVFMSIYFIFLMMVRELTYADYLTTNSARIVNGLGSMIPLIGVSYMFFMKYSK